MRKALLQGRNGKDDFYAQHSICNVVDLVTSRAQIFHEREVRSVAFLSFLRQKRAREQELDLFPQQKNASSEVILARTICVPVAFVCRRELSKYVKTNK